MATKKPATDDSKKKKPEKEPVKTQMQGESGDDDLGYDPKIIPTEDIPDE